MEQYQSVIYEDITPRIILTVGEAEILLAALPPIIEDARKKQKEEKENGEDRPTSEN